MPPSSGEIPMSRTLQSNDWENLDALWGINPPKRYIYVPVAGFRLRKKIGIVGGKGSSTPIAVNYGGLSAIVGHIVQVKGNSGQTVYFVQGDGEV